MVHCYKLGGLNIVLDICSGSVHVVDEVAYDVIEMYENKTHDEITAEFIAMYHCKFSKTKILMKNAAIRRHLLK